MAMRKNPLGTKKNPIIRMSLQARKSIGKRLKINVKKIIK